MPKLEEYKKKRDFSRTPEPQGTQGKGEEKLSYVIHHHIASRDHYDLRLEWGGVLLSWAVPKGPSQNPKDKRLAIQVEDHPLEYKDFEGNIPEGEYGAGTVMIWDEGHWAPQGGEDAAAGLAAGELKFQLYGKRLKGKYVLVRFKNGEEGSWLLIKEKDGYARSGPPLRYETSARTRRSMAAIERAGEEWAQANPIGFVPVQLATAAGFLPKGEGWAYEIKYDGFRMEAVIEGGKARLYSRSGKEARGDFAGIAEALASLAGERAMILDGEVIVTDEDGRPDFSLLQRRSSRAGGSDPIFVAFDLLALDGADLRGLALSERKEKLKALIGNGSGALAYSHHVVGDADAVMEAACQKGLEGVVAKRLDSPYLSGRSSDWVKCKCLGRSEFAIGGYSIKAGSKAVSSLHVGYWEEGELVYAGRIGTGFSQAERSSLKAMLEPLAQKACPFASEPDQPGGKESVWVRPQLVCEAKYQEFTPKGLLRHASYLGLREDKEAVDVKAEKAPAAAVPKRKAVESKGGLIQGVKITHPDKLMYPQSKVTKKEVALYYEAVADKMLPLMGGRIVTAVRSPDGIEGESFYKKHPDESSRWLKRVLLPGSDGQEEEYFAIASAKGLVGEAQMGTLEFHVWASKLKSLEKPDMMVFDLDPDEGLEIEKIRRGALDLKAALEETGLESFLKTSGGKGYHIVVPLQPKAGWEAFSGFAKSMAEAMEARWPDRYTAYIAKKARKGRIFVDWMRNARGATAVSAYSLRAREDAPVSMPIAWDELKRVLPASITMGKALRRLKGDDPWENFGKVKQSLRQSGV